MLTRQGNVFHFRRKVPVRLRPLIGKSEIWRSLGTANSTQARAKAGVLYAVVERCFDVARKVIGKGSLEEQERAVLEASLEEAERIIEAQRQAAELGRETAELRAVMTELKSAQEQSALVQRLGRAADLAQRVDALRVEERQGREQAEAVAAEARRHGEDAKAMAQDIAAAAAIVQAQVKPPGPLASSLLAEHWQEREAAKTRKQVISQERTTLKFFLETCGDRPVDSYDRGDITRFLNQLRRLPRVYGRKKADADLTMEQIIARADEQGSKRLNDKTVKRHHSALTQYFQHAVDVGAVLVSAKRDMLSEHRFRTKKKSRNQRDIWTSDELKILFTSPVWTGCASAARRSEPGDRIIRDWRFWLPLLALYHGGRLEEFADLYRRDVICDEGTWAIVFQPSADEDDDDELDDEDETDERLLKNENAERTIALHPELLRMGFVEYVLDTAPSADDPLFPTLAPQGADQKRGPRVTRWFVTYRRRFGIYRHGVAMHAFRHTANTRLRNAIKGDPEQGYQRERHVNYMLGHSMGPGEGGRRYDKGPMLKAAAETLALLEYRELDLSHLYAA